MSLRAKPEVAENDVTDLIIGCAIEVHRHLGPGLLESVYEECLCYELSQAGLSFQRQVATPINYKGIKFDCGHRLDLLVENSVVVEIKAIDRLMPIDSSQLLTYLKALNKHVGLLMNFNVAILKHGPKRVVNRYTGPPLPAIETPRVPPPLRTSALDSISHLSSPSLQRPPV
jgi:GxxExxY protein